MAAAGILAASIFAAKGGPACADTPGPFQFLDATRESQLDFRHHSPLSDHRHIHLYMGSGLAWFDYDRDGWPDLFFAQGLAFPSEPSGKRPSDQAYRNRQNRTFENVTEAAGLADEEFSMGSTVGDYDNDGFSDLYVSNFGENRLYQNNGDGTFREVGRAAGVNHSGYGASCAWGDFDGDGNLDLFVVNYIKIDLDRYPLCRVNEAGKTLYVSCHPRTLPGEYDVLYHNRGDGCFEDSTESGGLTKQPPRQGLGIGAADLDGDGDLDVYVANDTVPNQLWENEGRGTFVDRGLISGTSVSRTGAAQASMGVAVGDVDGDGRFELFVTNYFKETTTLYRNEGNLLFVDVTEDMGLAAPTRLRLGFGTSFIDADNDGWLDCFVANGHVQDRARELGRNDEPFAQLPQLFRNQQGKRFHDESKRSGDYFTRTWVGRGCATADYDRDGRVDLAVQHLDGPPVLLRNTTQKAGRCLSLELIGRRANRGGVGATVRVQVGPRELTRVRQAGTSYLSSDEERLLIGLGPVRQADRVTIQWPGGGTESWRNVVADGVVRLVEGTGEGG